MDILDEVLKTLRLSSRVFLDAKFCDEWVIDISPMNLHVSFHMIARGECWLHTFEPHQSVALHEGDLVLCLRNTPHYVTNNADLPPDDLKRNTPTADPEPENATQLICGYCEFLQYYWNPILESLEDILVIPTNDASKTSLASVINLMIAETSSGNSGSSAIIDRLSDILFIEAVRTYMLVDESKAGYLAALKEPRICKALTRFHKEPAINWSVQLLSEEAGMSRSGFADQFKQMVGMSPMEYVTGWRMQYAYDALVSDGKSVMQIADDCGYQSEPAFRKAFKKQFGTGPGAVRKNAREQVAAECH